MAYWLFTTPFQFYYSTFFSIDCLFLKNINKNLIYWRNWSRMNNNNNIPQSNPLQHLSICHSDQTINLIILNFHQQLHSHPKSTRCSNNNNKNKVELECTLQSRSLQLRQQISRKHWYHSHHSKLTNSTCNNNNSSSSSNNNNKFRLGTSLQIPLLRYRLLRNLYLEE